MPDVPDLNLPKRDFGKWTPDKQEIHNMRYWKGKKASIKPIRRARKPSKAKDPGIWRTDKTNKDHLHQIMTEE